ncbi:hypothetical protein SELMODRAFT_1415, partial [Selaginella moellendorffii]
RALARANDELASEIDERKRIEVELQMAKDAAVAADKAKSEFLANMSHEIRTPLNGIINCTELCLDTRTSLEQQEYLDLVRFSAKHLLRIITDILDFSKIEAGKLEMEEIQFSLYDQLEHAVSVLAARAHKKGLEIAWRAALDVPDQLIGDPGRLFQIFVNLIGNSIKFTEKGEVVVSAQVHNIYLDRVELIFAVKDTGVGIPKAKQSLLFQAFSQVDSSTTRWLYGGTGLGLVISSKLAAAMAGKMWVESEGKGSIFYFTAAFDIPPSCDLPLIEHSQQVRFSIFFHSPFTFDRASLGQAKLEASPEEHKSLKILVAEDNIVNQRVAVSLLRKWGHSAVIACNGAEAIEKASQETFDLILMDVQMPICDGFQATTKIREMEKNKGMSSTPIVAMTAHAMFGDGDRCIAAGMDGYISKPLNAKKLQELL